ncbi:MAG TPA: RNA-binding protein [Capsulimonadaceae bacterium]|nr:RNA-binding protein [Capsulimonadaceae bacterium]
MAIRLYVGNLSYQTTEDDLRETFAEAGNVASASVMTDRYSGQSRGFGFVEMATDEEAQNAIKLFNGRSMGGRALVVNEARPREMSGGGGGGFRSGGNDGGGGGGRDSRSGGGGGRGNRGSSNDRYDRDRY